MKMKKKKVFPFLLFIFAIAGFVLIWDFLFLSKI